MVVKGTMLEPDPKLEKNGTVDQGVEKMLTPYHITYITRSKQLLVKLLMFFICFKKKGLLSVSNVLNYSVLNKY